MSRALGERDSTVRDDAPAGRLLGQRAECAPAGACMSASEMAEVAALPEHVVPSQRRTNQADMRGVLRDAVCVRALLEASDARSAGDDAEGLLGESIAVLAANIWCACWESPNDTVPHEAMHAAGQLGALARARNSVLQEALTEPDDRHSFLVDQVGWLDTMANETATRLIYALRAMVSPVKSGGAT